MPLPDELNMSKLYGTATRHAAPFGKEPDFSDGSINDVEEILDYYTEKQRDGQNRLSDYDVWTLSLIWGSYIGETLRRNHLTDYRWELNSEDVAVLRKKGGLELSPITKVFKRINNGMEDSIVSFYDISIAINNGKINPGK